MLVVSLPSAVEGLGSESFSDPLTTYIFAVLEVGVFTDIAERAQ